MPRYMPMEQENGMSPSCWGMNSMTFWPAASCFEIPSDGTRMPLAQVYASVEVISQRTCDPAWTVRVFGEYPLPLCVIVIVSVPAAAGAALVPGSPVMDGASMLVEGAYPVASLERDLGRSLEETEMETVAGLLLKKFGRIPRTGARTWVGDVEFVVERASPRAIERIRITKKARAPEEPAAE